MDEAILVEIGDRITLALSVSIFMDAFKPLVDWDVDALLPPDPNAPKPKEKTLTDTLREYGAKLHRERQNFEAVAAVVKARILGQGPWPLPRAGGALPVRVVGDVSVSLPAEREEPYRQPEWVRDWNMYLGLGGRVAGMWLYPLNLPLLVPTIIDLVRLYKAWSDHLKPMVEGIKEIVARLKSGAAHVTESGKGMKEFILSQVWMAKVLAGFMDRLVLWSADRLTQIMRVVEGGYFAVAKVIGGFVDAIGFNAVTAVRTAIINALLVRLVNFINGKIIQIGVLIAAAFAPWEALFEWLSRLWDRMAVEFENAFLSALNALGTAMEAASKTLNSKTKGLFPVVPYTPRTLLPVPAVGSLDIPMAVAEAALDAATLLEKRFPTDYSADWKGPKAAKSIRDSWLAQHMAFPAEQERKQVPDLGPIPTVQASPVAPPPTNLTVADTGGPQAKGPESLHLQLAVERLSSATVGDLASQIATRIYDEFQRLGGGGDRG